MTQRSDLDSMTPLASATELEESRIRDAYARRSVDARYSFFSDGHLYFAQERERRILALLRRHGFPTLAGTRIIEIGSGNGYWLREFIKWGARPEHITGVELLEDRVAEAKELCPSGVNIHCGNAARLTLPDEAFDVVLQATAFTSILDADLKRQVAREMTRVMKSDGLIIWYDFFVDNPWNRDVRGIGRREIQELFPGCRVELQRTTVAPPLLRALAPYSWLGCYLSGRVPWLCTHYLGVIRKG